MKYFLFFVFSLTLFQSCSKHTSQRGGTFTITIDEVDKPKDFTVPLACKGWSIRGVNVLKNTANDTLKFGEKYFAPGETGLIYRMECYDCYLLHLWAQRFNPYKATAGKVVLQYFMIPDAF